MPITDATKHREWREKLRAKALERQPRICTVDGCDRPTVARGFCRKHHRAWCKANPELVGPFMYKDKPCTIEGCDALQRARGYCNKHWTRWQRKGDPLAMRTRRGEGYTIDEQGYRVVFVHGHPNADSHGRILEHRKVMTEILGRPLLPGESVHHRNGVRTDNRPENLEVWVNYQPVGGRVEDVLAWADEILARYGEHPAN